MGAKVVVVLGVFVAIVVLIVALVAVSLKKLSSKEVGLQYNTIQKNMGDEVYTEGLHTGPPGYEFIIFPNIFTSWNHKLTCLNNDGLKVTLTVSFQYRIQMTNMRKIIMEFKDFETYQTLLNNVGMAVLHETCSYFNTSDFQARRGEFEDKLSDILRDRFDDVGCEVEGLQVNNIDRPSLYERAIRSKERAKEDIVVADQERPRLVTEATTKKRKAESEATIILDKAESDARILNKVALSEAKAIKEQYDKEAEAYESIMGSSGLSFTPEGFISYLGVRVIADAKNPVYIGLKSPAKSSFIKS